MRPACRACDDFTNIYSDISFGGLGSQDKYTTVITRTEKGADLFSKIKNSGIIRVLDINKQNKNKMIDLISQFSQSKIERKEKFMKNLK
jgi:coenzyme F420 hydrogenase subunit beta